jgi:hypothetical protein
MFVPDITNFIHHSICRNYPVRSTAFSDVERVHSTSSADPTEHTEANTRSTIIHKKQGALKQAGPLTRAHEHFK